MFSYFHYIKSMISENLKSITKEEIHIYNIYTPHLWFLVHLLLSDALHNISELMLKQNKMVEWLVNSLNYLLIVQLMYKYLGNVKIK